MSLILTVMDSHLREPNIIPAQTHYPLLYRKNGQVKTQNLYCRDESVKIRGGRVPSPNTIQWSIRTIL